MLKSIITAEEENFLMRQWKTHFEKNQELEHSLAQQNWSHALLLIKEGYPYSLNYFKNIYQVSDSIMRYINTNKDLFPGYFHHPLKAVKEHVSQNQCLAQAIFLNSKMESIDLYLPHMSYNEFINYTIEHPNHYQKQITYNTFQLITGIHNHPDNKLFKWASTQPFFQEKMKNLNQFSYALNYLEDYRFKLMYECFINIVHDKDIIKKELESFLNEQAKSNLFNLEESLNDNGMDKLNFLVARYYEYIDHYEDDPYQKEKIFLNIVIKQYYDNLDTQLTQTINETFIKDIFLTTYKNTPDFFSEYSYRALPSFLLPLIDKMKLMDRLTNHLDTHDNCKNLMLQTPEIKSQEQKLNILKIKNKI